MNLLNATPWHLVIPVKGTPGAKSRLRPPAGVTRAALATALALDTIEGACEALRRRPGSVLVVVTSDPQVRTSVAKVVVDELVRFSADPGRGLNAALDAGLDLGAPTTARAVLLGDLPCLTADDLDAALDAAGQVPLGVVPDAAGTGTALLTARPGHDLHPSFGVGSAQRHLQAGHVALPAGASLRTDVDDGTDLQAAILLGLRRHTRALLATPLS